MDTQLDVVEGQPAIDNTDDACGPAEGFTHPPGSVTSASGAAHSRLTLCVTAIVALLTVLGALLLLWLSVDRSLLFLRQVQLLGWHPVRESPFPSVRSASASTMFRASIVATSIQRNTSCARQLSSPVLAYWLGLPIPSASDGEDSHSQRAAASGELLQQLDVQSVIAALRADRHRTTLQVRERQLESALQAWFGSSVAMLPGLAQQRLRADDTLIQQIDNHLNATTPHTAVSSTTSLWLSLSALLHFDFATTLSDVTTLSLTELIPVPVEEQVALSSQRPVLLAVPSLYAPFAEEQVFGSSASPNQPSGDPFSSLASYHERVAGGGPSASSTRPSLRGTAARLISSASLPSDRSASRSVLYSNLSPAAACAVVFVPHVRPRANDAFPRWLDTNHGPDSLVVSLNDDEFEFARSLDFVPVVHSDLSYPSSLSELPFPLSLMHDSWQLNLQQSRVLEPYEVTVRHTVAVNLSWQLSGSDVKLHTTVPVSVRVAMQVQPGIAVDLGWGVYASDVQLPSLSSISSAAAPSNASAVLRLRGYVDYRNFEWNAERHNTRLQREALSLSFADNFSFVPSTDGIIDSSEELKANTAGQSNTTAANETRVVSARVSPPPPPPVCSAADGRGYWAAQGTPLARIGNFSWSELSALPTTARGMSYFGDGCVYRPFSWQEGLTCLAQRYPSIHWFGDSNSRRDIRTLYTAGRWLDVAFSCEDWEDSVLAGNVTNPNFGWPYPTPSDSPVFINNEHVKLRLPGGPGEPLSANGTTGAWIKFDFLAGLSGDMKTPDSYFTSGPADLLILGLGSWEPMMFQWDMSSQPQFDLRRYNDSEFEKHNLTRNLLDAAALIHKHYVLPNPNVTIVLRTAPAMAEHVTQLDSRHYSHQRIESFKRRIVRVLQSSVIRERLKIWVSIQQPPRFKLTIVLVQARPVMLHLLSTAQRGYSAHLSRIVGLSCVLLPQDIQQLYSYKLHSLPSDDGSELCSNSHVGPVTIRTELNVLFHALCPTG